MSRNNRLRELWKGTEDRSTGRSRRLRDVLRARREDLGASRPVLGQEIAAFLNARNQALGLGEKEVSPLHTNTIYSWENFIRHPNIDHLAAWVRVLGGQLHVLVSFSPGEEPVMLDTPEATYVARTVDTWPEDLRRIVLEQVDEIDASLARHRTR